MQEYLEGLVALTIWVALFYAAISLLSSLLKSTK